MGVLRQLDPVKFRKLGCIVMVLFLVAGVYGCGSGFGSDLGSQLGSGLGSAPGSGLGSAPGSGLGPEDAGTVGEDADSSSPTAGANADGVGDGHRGASADDGRDAGPENGGPGNGRPGNGGFGNGGSGNGRPGNGTSTEGHGRAGELPPGFPVEIPVPDNAAIELAHIAGGQHSKEMYVQYLIPGQVADHTAHYEKFAAEAGYEITYLSLDDDSDFHISRMNASRGDTSIEVIINDITGRDGTIVAAITYTVGASVLETREYTWSYPPRDSDNGGWLAWFGGGGGDGSGGSDSGSGGGSGGEPGGGSGGGSDEGSGAGHDDYPGGFEPVVGMRLPDDWGWPADIPLPEPIDIMKARPEPSSKIQTGGSDDGTVVWSVIYRAPGEPAEYYELYLNYVEKGFESHVYAEIESWEGDPSDPLSDWGISAWTASPRDGAEHVSIWIFQYDEGETRVHINYDENYKFWN